MPSKVSVFVITLRPTAVRKCYIFCFNSSENYCRMQSAIPLQTEHTYTHHTLRCRITTLCFYIFNKF